jgi:hypothetical protein
MNLLQLVQNEETRRFHSSATNQEHLMDQLGLDSAYEHF